MIENLKDLKDTYESARSQIDKAKEPLEDLIKIKTYLNAVASDIPVFLEKFKEDKDYLKFFFDDFTGGILKRITKERSRDDKYLDVISGVLEEFMNIFLQMLREGIYNQQFFDGIKFLFEYDSILHNFQYQIPEDQLKRLRSANQEWRQDLKEGDMVDAIADETNARYSGWSQARISSVNGDLLQLEFINDVKAVDKYKDRWSVEIAQFESKTKEIFEWKSTLQVGMLVDANDKSVWNKSTILEIKEQQITPTRVIKMAMVGYRVYVENGSKTDEKGQFDGWSSKFDELIAIYSPRIMPFYSKTQKGVSDDLDLDEDLDSMLQPDEGFSRVYAVPRIRKCISSVFLHLINYFGNNGGFDLILQLLAKNEAISEANEESKEQNEGVSLNILGAIIQCISCPYLIYHKQFMQEYGPKFVELCIKALRGAPEKSLRDVRREKIEQIIKSIDNFQRRLITKEEREKQTEVLKLEIALMCLKSSYLERRIQGIRDLNQIIKNLRMFSSSNKAFTGAFLVEWMTENGVFNIVFDVKRTHLQIVQRCSDIMKLLTQENMLTEQIQEQFWSLAKVEYKFEVYKILNECAFYFKQEHINYFFEHIRQIPLEKLGIEEFQCLSELGKFTKDDKFKVAISEFFWAIICNSDNVKEELVNNCITKFCEMVKNWDLSRKHQFFIDLTQNLKENKSSIPSLRLFKGLIKDQKDRQYYNSSVNRNNYNNYGTNYNSNFNNYGNASYGGSNLSQQQSAVQTSQQQATSDTTSDVQITQELTLQQSISTLINEQSLIGTLLENLAHYIHSAREKVTEVNKNVDRKKLNLLNPKYSHHDEIDERLQFLKYIAQVATDYQVSKEELGKIYELLCKTQNYVLQSDYEEFLIWCKSSCEQSTTVSQILDLNEVGQFFTEKMQNGELDVKNLIVVGFDFLQQYFISVNESQQKLMKVVPKVNKSKYNSYGGYTSIQYGYNQYGQYGPKNIQQNKTQEEETTSSQFKLSRPPTELSQLDIVWNMALHCDNPKVVPKAIDFLIKVYYSLDADIDNQKLEIQDGLINECMRILRESKDQHTIIRVIEIIKNIIQETEKKGTGDVKPHNALLKGELLENITIKNKASTKVKNLLMKIYSNATVWEFKKEVSRMLDLAPKYLKVEIGVGGKVIKDTENGKTLAQLGIQSGDFVTAYKMQVEEEIPNAPLIGPDQKLTEKASQIFNEWFDLYSDETGSMTRETCSLFIKGCTGEQPLPNDDRIQGLFKTYDTNNDGKIERADFLVFYENAARTKSETVRENLKAHNIRNDLKKLSEITEDSSFQTEDMPRYKISKNQDQFDLLISLLDRQDEASQASWDLIQMLATNQELYKRVLQLQTALDPHTKKLDWSKFFDNQSVYKLLYTLQIVEAVMEEGEGEGLECAIVIEDSNVQDKKRAAAGVPDAPPLLMGPLPPNMDNIQVTSLSSEQVIEKEENTSAKQEEPAAPQLFKRHSVVREEEDKELRSNWTSMFLQHNGFQYILQVFMEKEIKSGDQNQFELKHIAFLLKLLRIFIMAAFSTSSDSQVYSAVSLIRRSSSMQDEESQKQVEQLKDNNSSRFAELQNLMTGPIGEEIIKQIDYKQLQQKILTLISQVLNSSRANAMTFEDKLIIENALSLWVGCILHKNELLNDFFQINSDEFILQGLLFCNQEKVREEFKQSLNQLSQGLLRVGDHSVIKESPLIYLLRLLSDKFGFISQYHCKQYFDLFCELIDHYFNLRSLAGVAINGASTEVFNPESLLSLLIDKIKEYNDLANSQTSEDDEKDSNYVSEQEQIYIGLIQLTGKIIDNFDISLTEKLVEQKSLIDEIFVKFLFSSVFKQTESAAKKQNSVVKIKPRSNNGKNNKKSGGYGKKSKDVAYKMLVSLIRKSPLLMSSFLEKSMVPLMSAIKRHDGWNYQPPGQQEFKQKYVGLYNFGCICYMNSMLQQFFMIPSFRYNLLSVDDAQPEDIQEYKGHKIDDNVLHQLQRMMAHLELSERQDFQPLEFCFAFKDFDGNPTNTAEQKDAQEFLNLAFDRIENGLKNTKMKYLMQSVFSGQTCSQIVCLECGKVRNRIEDFYNLSLTVKDTKSMYESLQKLIEGETINNYECDKCKKKVDISKRVLISQAPNVLIVHLQRIIFNFETFRNDKINSFFEFPFQLDLKPYSFYDVMHKENRLKSNVKEGEDQEEEQAPPDEDSQTPEEETCFEYKLVGVNVHSGTANAGHYWSFINTRRGVDEPDENDPDWAKTENDPWMKFNDSSVTEYNFEKLKGDCYGGDGKSGGETDSWSFGGNYGQSAYMLIYEKRQKRPIKILATPDEVETDKANLHFDPKKEEYYKLVDYRNGVQDIESNAIYNQVFNDNHKFEFENDIYSSEFYKFVNQIISAVHAIDQHAQTPSEDLEKAKHNMLIVAKKTIFDLLAKTFHNNLIKDLVESLQEVLLRDDKMVQALMQILSHEDDFDYVFDILLECTDNTSRMYVGQLMKFLLNRLKVIERDYLTKTEKEEYKTEDGETREIEVYVAYSARFIDRALQLLKTKVAKNWIRFDHFLEIIYSFAVETYHKQFLNTPANQKLLENYPANPDDERIGLEFLAENKFVYRACDWMLGKKSPLVQNGEKRIEMGGYNSPNFTPFIKLITSMISDKELLRKFPLDLTEKKLFLQPDLLKTMMSQPQGAKQFGHCLAEMCKNNLKLSQLVSQVFIKAFNNSNSENLKAYLKALKPFLRSDDEFKLQKLEWVFGFPQLVHKKTYREDKYRYGLEFVERINEDAYTYMSPLIAGPNEESLFSQLYKCKGKFDTNCILCLKEMLHLMSKDDMIARFVYKTAPPNYQSARFTDWIRPYLETQRIETEKSGSYNAYFKSKYETVLKSLIYLERFDERVKVFREEERQAYEAAQQQEGFSDIERDWLAYKNTDVINHFPPQLIIGRQVTDDKEILVYDEDPNVKVTVIEVGCEYNYSNPTGFFNVSLPHIEAKTTMYQTMSYQSFKRVQLENQRIRELKQRLEREKQELSEQQQQDATEDSETTADTSIATADTTAPASGLEANVNIQASAPLRNQQESVITQDQLQAQFDLLPPILENSIQVINWFQTCKSQPPVLLRVLVTNKNRTKIRVKVSFKQIEGGEKINLYLPQSGNLRDTFFDNDTRCLCHLQKIDPTKPFGDFTVEVDVKEDTKTKVGSYPNNTNSSTSQNSGGYISTNTRYSGPPINVSSIGAGTMMGYGNSATVGTDSNAFACWNCQRENFVGMEYCQHCGEGLNSQNDASMEGYFNAGGSGMNFMS